MRYLLDTHALIWHLEDDARLSVQAKSVIEDDQNEIIATIASFWEMAIKINLGKLVLKMSLDEMFEKLDDMGIRIITIQASHIHIIETLPLHHRDPFDRMIIAQADAEKCIIISIDEAFDAYQTAVLW
jgi:PIN domain nuclease of toxin-antitoxin system